MGNEIVPAHQRGEVLLQLVKGIFLEMGIFFQLMKDVLRVNVGLHMLMPFEAEMQNGTVTPGIVRIQVAGLRNTAEVFVVLERVLSVMTIIYSIVR